MHEMHPMHKTKILLLIFETKISRTALDDLLLLNLDPDGGTSLFDFLSCLLGSALEIAAPMAKLEGVM
jgi:hypothetical protein